jgi:hypothetical protein
MGEEGRRKVWSMRMPNRPRPVRMMHDPHLVDASVDTSSDCRLECVPLLRVRCLWLATEGGPGGWVGKNEAREETGGKPILCSRNVGLDAGSMTLARTVSPGFVL